MKKKIVIAAMLVLSLAFFNGCEKKDSKPKDKKNDTKTEQQKDGKNSKIGLTTTFKDEPILDVDGTKIMLSEANILINNLKSMYPPETFAMKGNDGKTMAETFKEKLKEFFAKRVTIKKLAEENKIKLDDKDKKEVKDLVADLFNKGKFTQKQVDTLGITRAKMEELGYDSILERKLIEKEIKKIDVDKKEYEKALKNNPEYNMINLIGTDKLKDSVTVKHILISTRDAKGKPFDATKKAEAKKKIEGILKKAKAGEDFAKLAKENSEDPGSKDKGGEYTFGRGKMVKEFEDVSFNLKEGQISGVVETQFGYHIIKLDKKHMSTEKEKKESKEELKKLEERIKDSLKVQQYMKVIDEKVKSVKVNPIEAGWKKVVVLTDEDKKKIEENKKAAEKRKKEFEKKQKEDKKKADEKK
ncbi:MAG: hypothetical protein CSB15_00230 [Clostridiales bacterium]|nr:MAG: hypothetical protein CSB15_00230 [Clostridiales bacterium]